MSICSARLAPGAGLASGVAELTLGAVELVPGVAELAPGVAELVSDVAELVPGAESVPESFLPHAVTSVNTKTKTSISAKSLLILFIKIPPCIFNICLSWECTYCVSETLPRSRAACVRPLRFEAILFVELVNKCFAVSRRLYGVRPFAQIYCPPIGLIVRFSQ